MNTPALKRFRQKLAADEAVYGLWVTLESPSISEMAVAVGMDWIVIDAEHGHLDWKEIVGHLRTTVRSDTVALVRVAELNITLVKRALDVGADGVVVPWMESAQQLREAVDFAHYPPIGRRGMGGERATCWGHCVVDHVAEADENVLVVPIIESVRAAQNIHQLVREPGVDVFFFGPSDFSSTAGYPGQWEGPGVAEKILAAHRVIQDAGKKSGLLTTSSENLLDRRQQGFRMIGVGLDGGLLLRTLKETLAPVDRTPKVMTTFIPEEDTEAAATP